MDERPTWTDCDEAGDYVVPNVLSPRDLVFRPDIMYETVTQVTDNLLFLNQRKGEKHCKKVCAGDMRLISRPIAYEDRATTPCFLPYMI